MRKLILSCFVAGVMSTSCLAQTLFTYGNQSVSKDEFLRVYKKNSINKKPDMSEKELRGYLDLYTLFRMKVAEANKQQLDTVASIDRELSNYRKQLAKNYLTDEKITNQLIREAYDRLKENVKVAHILISCPPASDTVAPRKTIDSIYNVVKSGKATFESMAMAFSADKGSAVNGGDIGYITSLVSIYPFENAAYNTRVGKVSEPFKTQFGYHILKVLDRRDDMGKVEVAQILIRISKSEGEAGEKVAEKRADSVLKMLKKGASFSDMVAKYSDDKFSVKDDGVLKPFRTGKMVPAFEEAAFALKKPGEISKPIKTEYGLHIIKLIKKYPIEPFDSLYSELKHKVENDSRAQIAKDIFYEKVKSDNGFKEHRDNYLAVYNKLIAIPDTGVNANSIMVDDFRNMNNTLFELSGKKYTQSDFVAFLFSLTRGKLNGPKNAVVRDAYDLYVNKVVTDFKEHRLVEENPEFKTLMDEYRDGIMLFELMDRNVWSKAAKDSVGLEKFFNAHKDKYMWEAGFDGAVYKFKSKAAYDTGMIMIRQDKFTEEEIAKAVNSQGRQGAVTVQRGRYEFSKFHDATKKELSADKIKVIQADAENYTVIVAKEVFAGPEHKTLEEAKGYVVAEYQDYLEKEWNKKMRSTYPVKVNEKVFMSMVK